MCSFPATQLKMWPPAIRSTARSTARTPTPVSFSASYRKPEHASCLPHIRSVWGEGRYVCSIHIQGYRRLRVFLSAAKPRPWNSRCCSCCWGGLLSRYRNLSKITLIKNYVVMNCVNFGITLTNTLKKITQNNLMILQFSLFLIFLSIKWPLILEFWHYPPNII